MIIKLISEDVFETYAKKHILKNFYQTIEYGKLMSNNGYSSLYVGGFINNELVSASLLLCKSLGPNIKYGYAPRGFLINYYDTNLLKEFSKKIKEFFLMKGFAFIKINPEITYYTLDYTNQTKILNTKNKNLIELLKEIGYDKLKDNLYFESLLPKYNPIIFLPNYNFNSLDKKMNEDAKSYELKGINLIHGNENNIETAYEFIKNKTNKNLKYYKDMYEIFNKSNMIDLLLVELKYENYIKYLQKQYIYEAEINEQCNNEFNQNTNDINIYNKKMESDKRVNNIKRELTLINKRMKEEENTEILGAAFIIKYEGRVTLLISGQKNDFQELDIKTYLFYKIIEKYKKNNYLYLDMNGITGDMSDSNPYKELNDFKLKFLPSTYEYIGEFDFIINKPFHQLLWSSGKIQKEFYKPPRKSQ